MTNALKIETFPYFFAIAKIRNPASINWKSPFVLSGRRMMSCRSWRLSQKCRQTPIPLTGVTA